MILISAALTLGLNVFGQSEKPEKFNSTKPAPPASGFAPATPAPPLFGGQSTANHSFGSAMVLYGAGGVSGVSSSGSGGIPPVVVRFKGGDEEVNAALEEDLNIMTHLIERSLQTGIGDETPELKSGIPILFSDGRSVRGMYLDGFGVLFMIKVRFPVFAPSAPEPKEPPPSSDTEWDKVKRELYGEAEGRAAEVAMAGNASQFDRAQVEELEKVLLQTLKNASNIHNLNPDDSIAITVFGQPSTVSQVRKSRAKGQAANSLPAATTAARGESSNSRKNALEAFAEDQKGRTGTLARDYAVLRTSTQGTVLTLRVKKSDVDAFSTGKLDFEAFHKRAQQNSYPGSGYGITSINSWSKGGVAH